MLVPAPTVSVQPKAAASPALPWHSWRAGPARVLPHARGAVACVRPGEESITRGKRAEKAKLLPSLGRRAQRNSLHPCPRAARAAQPARGPAGEAERLQHRCPRAASAGPPRPLPCFSPGSVPRVMPLRSCPARASRPRPRHCRWGPLRPREPCSGVSTCARCSGSRYFCGDRGGGQPGRAIQSLVLPRSHSVTPRIGTCTKCRPSLTPVTAPSSRAVSRQSDGAVPVPVGTPASAWQPLQPQRTRRLQSPAWHRAGTATQASWLPAARRAVGIGHLSITRPPGSRRPPG